MDTLNIQIIDNIRLPAKIGMNQEGKKPISADSIIVLRGGALESDTLFFRMPVNAYPVRFEIGESLGEMEEPRFPCGQDFVELPPPSPLAATTAKSMGMEDSLSIFGVPPVLATDSVSVLVLDISLEANFKWDEAINLVFPFSSLPDTLKVDGKELMVSLRYTDCAGHKDSLVLGQEVGHYLLSTGEVGSLLVDKMINFPNPFTALPGLDVPTGTTIRFVLTPEIEGSPTTAKLRIFDTGGEQVYVADLGELRPGENLKTWSGHDIYGHPLATGVYFAILEIRTADRKEIKKLKIAVLNRK